MNTSLAPAFLLETEGEVFSLFTCRRDFESRPVSVTAFKDLYRWPALQSLASRGVRLKLSDAETLARLETANETFHLQGRMTAAALALNPEACWTLLECIARWAIARTAVHQSRPQTTANADRWTLEFALRPLLFFYWSNGHLPCGFMEVSPDLQKLVEQSGLQKSYSNALQCFRTGLGVDKSHDVGSLELARFRHAKRQITSFRHTRDGVVLPLFGDREATFISAYNPPRDSFRDQQWRLHTSNMLLPASDFSLPFSKAEIRKPAHVPLQLRSATPAETCSVELTGESRLLEFLASGTIPVTARHADDGKWSVLMYTSNIYENSIHSGFTGRTGVLFKNGAPVIEVIDGVEHLVELKGMGSVGGGISSVMKRSDGTWSPTGGLLRSYAVDEYAALKEHDYTEIGPKPAALLTFAADTLICNPPIVGAGNPERKLNEWPAEVRNEIAQRLKNGLGLIIRLTPSVERLSFFENTGLGNSGSEQWSGFPVLERISLYGTAVGRLFKKNRMTAHLSAHLENIVAGEFGLFWQDFADIVPLYISRAYQDNPLYVSRKKLTLDVLNQVFFYVARTAQVFHEYFSIEYAEFSARFYAAFVAELKTTWEIPAPACEAMLGAREPLRINGEGITQFLWKQFIAADNYRWCLTNYDLPARLFGNMPAPQVEGETLPSADAEYFLKSEKDFLEEASLNCAPEDPLLRESLRVLEDLAQQLKHGNALTILQCKLPYLCESEKAPLPRKIQSWPK